MASLRPKISLTRNIPFPTYYIKALDGEFRDWAYNEERALEYKGEWREKAFSAEPDQPMDLEIGTGNGFYFAHHAKSHPDRLLVGIELKYKPLIQSIRRALNNDSKNAKILRYNARDVAELFAENELNNVYIHHPDPWIGKKSRLKNRLIQDEFLKNMFSLQKQNSFIEFKTDNRDYFDWAVEKFKESPYVLEALSYDLHNSEYADTNFITHFESIFLKQNLPIHYALLRKTV